MKQVYLIFYIALVQAACTNDCSFHGICKADQCSCRYDYIGSDCSRKSFPLKQEIPLTINQSGTVYHIFAEQNPVSKKLVFTFQNDTPQSGTFLVQISKLEELTHEYQEQFVAQPGKSIALNITSEVQSIGKMLIIQIDSKQDDSEITITYGIEKPDTATSSDLPILTIVLSTVLPVAIFGICVACHFRQKIKKCFCPRPSTPPIPPTPPIGERQIVPELPNNHLHPLPPRIDIRGRCSICNQNLQIGQYIVLTPCYCLFHSHCINQQLLRQNICAKCGQALQLNELIKIQMPSEIQG